MQGFRFRHLVFNLISYPANGQTPCEIRIIRSKEIPENCQVINANIQDYKLQRLSENEWLIATQSECCEETFNSFPKLTMLKALKIQNVNLHELNIAE